MDGSRIWFDSKVSLKKQVFVKQDTKFGKLNLEAWKHFWSNRLRRLILNKDKNKKKMEYTCLENAFPFKKKSIESLKLETLDPKNKPR